MEKKVIKKNKVLDNLKSNNKKLNLAKNENNLIRSTDRIKGKKNMKKNIHDSKILDTLLNESYL